MPAPLDDATLPAPADIAELLGSTSGTRTAVERLEPLSGRSWVLRAHLAPALGLPATVIVKTLRPEGYGHRSATELMRCELAALTHITDDLNLAPGGPGPALTPRLHAAAPDLSMLVLEDLAPHTELSALLRDHGATPALENRLTAFATALGTLAAASAGRAADFSARRSARGTSPHHLGDWEHAYLGLWRRGLARSAEFGTPLPPAAERDLHAAVAELADPGPFLTLTNGDTENHNYLTSPGSTDGRLIDFEGAAYRHALTAVSGFVVPGPNWLAVSGRTQVAAFRTALARTIPEAADDRRFGHGLTAAAMVWAMARSARPRMLDARPPGDHARLQHIALLEAAADTARAHRALPHLAAWCRSTAEHLRHRWPDTDIDTATLAPYTWRVR
jgi:hypothetical protein